MGITATAYLHRHRLGETLLSVGTQGDDRTLIMQTEDRVIAQGPFPSSDLVDIAVRMIEAAVSGGDAPQFLARVVQPKIDAVFGVQDSREPRLRDISAAQTEIRRLVGALHHQGEHMGDNLSRVAADITAIRADNVILKNKLEAIAAQIAVLANNGGATADELQALLTEADAARAGSDDAVAAATAISPDAPVVEGTAAGA